MVYSPGHSRRSIVQPRFIALANSKIEMPQQTKPFTFRMMTYNIHKGIGGLDRRYDLQRIVDVIGHYQPHIAFLQEVDYEVPRSKHHRQVEVLAERLDFEYTAFQKNVSVKQGHYGNAILSRFPLETPRDLELKVSIKKNRRALITGAEIFDGQQSRTLLLCNTHLGLAGFERKIQINRILKFEDYADLHPEMPAIIGGDFNDVWKSHGRKLMFPAGYQCAVQKARTFPAAFPLMSLDAIYYHGGIRLLNGFAGKTKLDRQASDHLPVIADFAFIKESMDHTQ